MIKAVVFDMGGVLLQLDIKKCIRSFKEKAGFEDIDKYLDLYKQQGFVGDLEAGKITGEQFIQECLNHSRPGTSRETVIECFQDFLIGLNGDMLDFIRELKGNYRLFLLSNNNELSIAAFDEMMKNEGLGLDETFEKCFCSFRMKMMKPSPEIYKAAIEGIGLKPEEIVFIDDSQANIAAAQAQGIRTILYEDGMDIRSAFRSICSPAC